MMTSDPKFSNRVQDVIRLSREEALRLGHDYVGAEHLLLGIIREGEGEAVRILKRLWSDLPAIKKCIESTVSFKHAKTGGAANLPLTKQAEKILKVCGLEAKLFKCEIIRTEHLLLALLRDDDNIASNILQNFSIHYDAVVGRLFMDTNADISNHGKVTGTVLMDSGGGGATTFAANTVTAVIGGGGAAGGGYQPCNGTLTDPKGCGSRRETARLASEIDKLRDEIKNLKVVVRTRDYRAELLEWYIGYFKNCFSAEEIQAANHQLHFIIDEFNRINPERE